MQKENLTIDLFYKEGESKKLLGLECEKGHVTVPPRHSCRVCASNDLKIIELKGTGKVTSLTRVFSKAEDFPLETPYVLGLVEIIEGGNLLGILGNDSKIGDQVVVRFSKTGEKTRIFFDPI